MGEAGREEAMSEQSLRENLEYAERVLTDKDRAAAWGSHTSDFSALNDTLRKEEKSWR